MRKKLIIMILSILIAMGVLTFVLHYYIQGKKETKGNIVNKDETTVLKTETEYEMEQNENKVPDNYIAVFNGGNGERTHSTYVYKIENGQENSGFRYINTENTTVSYGNPNWRIKITGQGEVQLPDDVFAVAEKNFAYSYVKVPNAEKIYTIEEFKKIFLVN